MSRFGCSSCRGSNHKLMGGYAGIATGLGFAVEYTTDAGAHAHGLCSLANMYSQNTLQEISSMLKVNSNTHGATVLDRIK
eukprot:8110740-Karenia_brevis.AAC.1